MPIYEYRCERGHTFEVLQRMTDDPVAVCTTCEATVQRVLHPVAVHFKGSGFYTTDYGKKGRGDPAAANDGTDAKGDKGSKDLKTSKGDKGSKRESKAGASKSGSKAGSSSD
jgi:putative FmdB family regulatory protein